MKLIFTALFFLSFTAIAQTDPVVADPPPDTETATIVQPTPAQKATITEAAKKAESETEKRTESGSPEPHHFGVHADLNLPHILNYGVDYWHASRWFSGAINFGGYSLNGLAKGTDTPNGVDLKFANQELMLRFHPFRGSFYAGLGYGSHTIDVKTQRTISVTTPVPGSADVEILDVIKANYLLPHVGWIWTWPFGLTLGMDVGYLSPINPSVDLTTTISNISNPLITQSDIEATTEYQNARSEIIDQSEKVGKTGLPYWTMFRIGFLF